MANNITSILSLQRHRDLLKMEYEYDKKSFDVQSSHVSIPTTPAWYALLIGVRGSSSYVYLVITIDLVDLIYTI